MSETSGEPPTEKSTDELAEPSPPERRRILWKLFLGFCVFSVVGFSLLAWYVTTDSFQQLARRRVIASAEKITGGRVELGELHTIPFRLRVDARNLTIHGKEASDQAPFLHIDRLQAELKIISLLSTTIGLHSLVLDHPVAHVIVNPDGSTNAPEPQVNRMSSAERGPVEELFSLSVAHIEAQRGELMWQDKKMPFDFDAREVALLLNYSLLRRRYEAHVAVGDIATRFAQYRSFAWKVDTSLFLSRGRADISNLTVASGKTEIHFAGSLQDFNDPRLEGDYHGTADIGELAALTQPEQARSAPARKGLSQKGPSPRGTVQFSGKGSWTLRDFGTQGTLQGKDLEWSNGKVSMKNGRVTANYDVTPSRFHVSAIKANLLGGDLQGDAEVINWQSSLAASPVPVKRHVMGRIPPESLQRGSVRLKLAGFPVLPALQWLSSTKLPLDQLSLSGNASGNVDTIWVGSMRDAETHLNLSVAPPGNPVANGVPVRGQVDAIYRGSRDELEVSQLHLTTPSSQIDATGNLAATSSLHFSLTSHNLKEWTPLLKAAYGPRELPFTVHGWATLSGNASGKLSQLSVNGNLEVYDFDTTLPATAQVASRVVHWDAVTAAVQYSSNHFAAHSGSLIHGHTSVHFDTNAELSGGVLLEGLPFTLHFDLRNADVAEGIQLAGIAQPFAATFGGTLDMSASISGTRSDPHGDGHLELHNAVAYGVVVPSLKSDLRLANGELQFNNLETGVYGAPLSGSAAISTSNLGTSSPDLSKTEFRLNISGRNLNLAPLARFQTGRFTAEGTADFTVQASGTIDQPSIEAHVHLKDLALDQERAGDFYVDAVTHGRQLEVSAHSDFDKADLTIQGSRRPRA